MSDEWREGEVNGILAKRLVRETGITEAQARELIEALGANWPSLVREARLIRKEP